MLRKIDGSYKQITKLQRIIASIAHTYNTDCICESFIMIGIQSLILSDLEFNLISKGRIVILISNKILKKSIALEALFFLHDHKEEINEVFFNHLKKQYSQFCFAGTYIGNLEKNGM